MSAELVPSKSALGPSAGPVADCPCIPSALSPCSCPSVSLLSKDTILMPAL